MLQPKRLAANGQPLVLCASRQNQVDDSPGRQLGRVRMQYGLEQAWVAVSQLGSQRDEAAGAFGPEVRVGRVV